MWCRFTRSSAWGGTERPFNGALPLHLRDEFAFRPFGLGKCHNQRVLRVEEACRIVPECVVSIWLEERNFVGSIREDRIAFANGTVRGNGIEHHGSQYNHGRRQGDRP